MARRPMTGPRAEAWMPRRAKAPRMLSKSMDVLADREVEGSATPHVPEGRPSVPHAGPRRGLGGSGGVATKRGGCKTRTRGPRLLHTPCKCPGVCGRRGGGSCARRPRGVLYMVTIRRRPVCLPGRNCSAALLRGEMQGIVRADVRGVRRDRVLSAPTFGGRGDGGYLPPPSGAASVNLTAPEMRLGHR